MLASPWNNSHHPKLWHLNCTLGTSTRPHPQNCIFAAQKFGTFSCRSPLGNQFTSVVSKMVEICAVKRLKGHIAFLLSPKNVLHCCGGTLGAISPKFLSDTPVVSHLYSEFCWNWFSRKTLLLPAKVIAIWAVWAKNKYWLRKHPWVRGSFQPNVTHVMQDACRISNVHM